MSCNILKNFYQCFENDQFLFFTILATCLCRHKMLQYIPANFLSVFGNLLVIVLSFQSKELSRHHSRYLIANTAFIDLCYSISCLYSAAHYAISVYYFGKKQPEISISECTLIVLMKPFLGLASFFSCISTIFCRFMEIVREKRCSKLRIAGLLLFPHTVFIFYGVYILPPLADTVRDLGNCKIRYNAHFGGPPMIIFLEIMAPFSVATHLFLSWKLYGYLKVHFRTASRYLRTNTVNYSYIGLGYTGICTYRTEN